MYSLTNLQINNPGEKFNLGARRAMFEKLGVGQDPSSSHLETRQTRAFSAQDITFYLIY